MCITSLVCSSVYVGKGMFNDIHRYSTLRKLISDQSGVDYSFIELFYENLPLKAKDSIPLDKYPDTTVSLFTQLISYESTLSVNGLI